MLPQALVRTRAGNSASESRPLHRGVLYELVRQDSQLTFYERDLTNLIEGTDPYPRDIELAGIGPFRRCLEELVEAFRNPRSQLSSGLTGKCSRDDSFGRVAVDEDGLQCEQ